MKNKKVWALVFGVLLIVFSLLIIFSFNGNEFNAFPIQKEITKETVPEIEFRDYGLTVMVFNELPVVPENFQEKAKLSNKNIPSEVFKQPEFIHNNWFENNCLNYYGSDSGYRGVVGYGFYPNYKRIVLEDGATEFSTEFFVHAGCGIQVFQSMHLVVSENKFVELDLNKSDFVLEPTFPVIYSNWIHKVKVIGRIKPDTPLGTHIVSINPQSLFGIGKDFFQLKVVVQ